VSTLLLLLLLLPSLNLSLSLSLSLSHTHTHTHTLLVSQAQQGFVSDSLLLEDLMPMWDTPNVVGLQLIYVCMYINV
jgi:hypothetical protein